MSSIPDTDLRLDNLNHEDTILHVVIQGPDHRLIHHHLAFSRTATGEYVVERLRELYYADRHLYRLLLEQYLMCCEPAIFSASVSRLSGSDVEAFQQHEVLIESKELDAPFTKAFYRPSLLTDVRDIAIAFSKYAGGDHMVPGSDQAVCLVCLRLQPTRVAVLILSGLVFSLSLGIIVGLVAHDAALGVAVGTGLGTFIFGMQGLLVWLLRRK